MPETPQSGRQANRDAPRKAPQPGIDEGPERQEILDDELQTERQAGLDGALGVPASDHR